MSEYPKWLRRLAAAVLLACGAATGALAHDDDDDRQRHRKFFESNARWEAECGACHVAFPPRLLPAESWREMMAGLDKHFGSDASLDAKDALEIGAYLERNASRRRDHAARPLLRITETRWFVHEHDEVPERVWKNPLVKSPANCTACHTQAASGNFSEREIRMPR